MTLSAEQIETFVRDGFVRLDGAFSHGVAAACRDILWRDMNLSPDRPGEWAEPVIRLGMYADGPFREVASSPRLEGALDQLVGVGKWIPPPAIGTLVVRFPVGRPWDDGWHIDASYPPPDDPQTQDYFHWRVNFRSRNRAMLMLFLFSDCGLDDAPTRVRVASHMPMARQLLKYGEGGLSLHELANAGFDSSADCETAYATGEAGTVWLLHPLTVHAAQAHQGTEARFLAQPGLGFRADPPMDDPSPVMRAIRMALETRT